MMRYWKLASVIALSASWIGCSQTTSAPTSQPGVTSSTEKGAPLALDQSVAPASLPVDASSSPHDVVMAFLNAMRDGNGRVTAALLTSKAQEETVKHDWPVQPPGAPTATYQLGPARYADRAQTAVNVPCVWTETDDQIGQTRFEVDWRLQRQPEGWRVAGFASQVVPGRAAYFFNFEDIANLKATQSEVEAALAETDSNQSTPPPVAQRRSTESTFR